MYDPIMRVLTVLEILQARERVTGSELAERMEVSLRTVQRYMARLQDLHIPVESVCGVGGYYQLKAGTRMPPLMFTDEEAFALTLGLRTLRHVGLSAFAPATEGAAAKLGRLLPESLRDGVSAVEDVVALEPGRWVVSTSGDSVMRMSGAIRARRRVAFRYQSHNGETSLRELEPYGVVYMDGRWYVAGRCLLRQALRTFRLDRLSELEVGDAMFIRPEGFDARAYLCEVMPRVQTMYDVDVWLALPPDQARCHFALHRVAMSEENGGTVIRCGRDSLEVFAAVLLSLGCRIEVRSPRELKETFGRLAACAAEAAADAPESTHGQWQTAIS